MDGPSLIGWREWVGLPKLGIRAIKAKVDTGARTTALHAVDIERRRHADGTDWLEFSVPAGNGHGTLRVEAPMIEEREVKNTSGVPDPRPVIQTTLSIDRRRWPIEITLADRTEMGFDVILGRTAIRRRGLLVDAGRSFLARPPLGFVPPVTADDEAGEDEAGQNETGQDETGDDANGIVADDIPDMVGSAVAAPADT